MLNPFWFVAPPSLNHIPHVVCVRSCVKMIWSNTRRVVTVMADEREINRNCAIVQDVREPMSKHGLARRACSEHSVSFGCKAALPDPARIGLFDSLPEAIFCWSNSCSDVARAAAILPALRASNFTRLSMAYFTTTIANYFDSIRLLSSHWLSSSIDEVSWSGLNESQQLLRRPISFYHRFAA